MVEIRKDELRVDEEVLRYITSEEMVLFYQICSDICQRIKAKKEYTVR